MGNPSACSRSQCMKNGVIKQKENACHVLSLILILLGPQQPTACISLNICLNCSFFCAQVVLVLSTFFQPHANQT